MKNLCRTLRIISFRSSIKANPSNVFTPNLIQPSNTLTQGITNNFRIFNWDIRHYSFIKMEQAVESTLTNLLTPFGIAETQIKEIETKKKYAERVKHVFAEAKVTKPNKEIGSLLLSVAEKLDPAYYYRLSLIVSYVLDKKITKPAQVDLAIDYLKTKGTDTLIEAKEFEQKVGIGIELKDSDIKAVYSKLFSAKADLIKLERYRHNFTNYQLELKKEFSYVDAKLAREILNKYADEFLGGKSETELIEESSRKAYEALKEKKKKADTSKKDKKKGGKDTKEPKDKETAEFTADDEIKIEELKQILKKFDDDYEKKVKETKINVEDENENETDKLSKIMGRDMASSQNSDKLLSKHREFTKGKVFTRFPPEPNGYLHIGHAKAMRFSFVSATKSGGNTYLRFDDTNPDKETKEFIDNIEENVRFLGYKPFKVTYASDYFEDLYNFAVDLIKKGKAYVCNLPKEQIKEDRVLMKDSPYRNRSVEENLELFTKMRQGRFTEKEACLRLKIDMKHPNTTMRDPVAYRIKYVPHPHVGDKWCIYPIYDFTHCISDSLENITHSLCTLEFEVRRDLYYWILEALDLYRPFVWEYSRLNITHNVLSKRRLTQLVEKNHVRGWDDPRLFTINGLRRRGYTAEAINHFVDTVGVTRRGNENIISIKVLENSVKQDLDKKAERTMVILEPLEINIVNWNESFAKDIITPLFPKNKELGEKISHLSKKIFIEKKDFRTEDDQTFFGLTPGQEVGLKYCGFLRLKEIKRNDKGDITVIDCDYVDEEKKTKGRIHWISDTDKIRAEVRWYNLFFKSENPAPLENWLDDVNPESEVIYRNALVNRNIANSTLSKSKHFQFERLGFFVSDYDTKIETNTFVFNLTVKI